MPQKCGQCGEEHDDKVSCLEALDIDSEQEQIEAEFEASRKRISALEDKDAIWDEDGRFWAVEEDGEEKFYDEDGNLM